jgi:Ca2+-binding EF-hand superfamily protein
MGQAYKPTKEDVKSYMKMVDKDGNGQISLEEFEDIVLESLRKAGFQIYQN